MNLSVFKNNFAVGLPGLALAVGIGLSTTANLQARSPQNREPMDQRSSRNQVNDGYADPGASTALRQTALNAGANAGLEAGREDRRKGNGYDFRDKLAFLKATKDYSTKLGDLGLYKVYFRQAFARSYADGYSGR